MEKPKKYIHNRRYFKINRYFLGGKYKREINKNGDLEMNCDVRVTFESINSQKRGKWCGLSLFSGKISIKL